MTFSSQDCTFSFTQEETADALINCLETNCRLQLYLGSNNDNEKDTERQTGTKHCVLGMQPQNS